MGSLKSVLSELQWCRVYFDTNPLIYFVEQNTTLFSVVSPIFDMIGTGDIQAFTSEFTLTEILIKPMRDKELNMIELYTDFLFDDDIFTLTKTTRNIFLSAAKIGGLSWLRTPDAIHMASALENECQFFITNDRKIHSQKWISVLYISDYL